MIEDLARALFAFTERQVGLSPYMTAIANMAVLRSDHPRPPAHRLAQPALCLVAQGAKWASIGKDQMVYRAGQALVVGVETPSVGRVLQASPEAPCLVLILGLDMAILRSVAEELDPPPRVGGEAGGGVFVADVEGPLTDCALRLVRLLETPRAIATLVPVIMREICYWLLTGPQGGQVARLALTAGPSHSVLTAVRSLRERFREPMRMATFARIAGMSPSAFHRQFKALTLQSPLQYQKRLRLLEARRLLITSEVKVETAAFEVGYVSPSQFSREYARMFGVSPKRDIAKLAAARPGAGTADGVGLAA